jgi:KaiC/GvpD/RAD55 family RecA-like ATPase
MFVRVCQGLSDRGKLIPLKQGAIKDLYKTINKEKDHYISLFQFNENQNKQFAETGTISGITDVIADRLTWDFDSESSLELARTDALTLCERLVDEGYKENQIQVYFSGNKGFEVTVQLVTSSVTPNEMKNICLSLAKGLSTIDTKIYNASRIFRLPLTKHQVSGLYKIPLSITDLSDMNVDEIVNSAKENLDYEQIESAWKPAVLTKALLKLKEASVKPKQKQIVEFTEELDLSNKPKWLSNWKYALSRGYYGSGMRNHALMILAATCRGNGFSDTQAYYFLKAANDEQSRRYNSEKFSKEEIWNNIIKVVYSPNWQGGTYAEENFPEEIKSFLLENGIKRGNEKIGTEDELIESVEDGFGDFVKYAKDIEKNTMKFGIPSLDKMLKVRKGHLIGLTAPPGVGKTTWAVIIANHMSKMGTHSYFASYDMYKNNLYQKLLQKHTGLDEDQLYKIFLEGDENKIKELSEILKENYGNVSFCFKTGQSITQLKAAIRERESKVGKPIDLVVVDYIELLLSDKSDPTAASAEAAQGLREIANEGRVVLVLLQPNKMSSKPNKPLTSYNAAKGSSAISQAVTAMLTMHRPGLHSRLNPKFDTFASIDCVKNRNGNLFSLDFYFDGKTSTISEIDDVGKATISQVRQMVRDLDNEENDDDF